MIQSQQTNGDGSIMMKNITASWTENTIANTLHDINVQIEPGKLYAIVGSVGAGKVIYPHIYMYPQKVMSSLFVMQNAANLHVHFQSSFLQLILKELQQSHGEIKVNGTVSYASQEAWLFSGTVRNNVLFGQSYDKEKYNDVVRACALFKDFQQFNYGDRTLVGDRGASLSGGQRARINLARYISTRNKRYYIEILTLRTTFYSNDCYNRAVYRNADIYLLDDPLSAVDTHVGKQLFNECIKNYLRNKTRILVTHQVQYLKDCDYIILLNNVSNNNQNCHYYITMLLL